ncbi:MAG TPA: hypothetical protein VK737_07230 [Opitutales bacterium]|jgi:hypothetical protein|nr:hypothetical protein [Opitutales bacterium]
MTMRTYPIFLLTALACGSALTLTTHAATTPAAASASGTAKGPNISDKDALKYLDAANQKFYNQDLSLLADGNQKITEGKKKAAMKPDPNNPMGNADIATKNQEGQAEIKEGNAEVKQANTDLVKLRQLAVDNMAKAKANAALTSAANLIVTSSQWPDVIADMTGKVLSSLADQKYQEVYLDNVYVYSGTDYTPNAALTKQVQAQLLKADKTSNILKGNHDWSFKIGQDKSKLIISFPERTRIMGDNVKAAIVLGEVLYETHSGYAAVSLRAVDATNMHILANQVMILSVEPTMAKLMDVPIYKVLAKRNAPGPDGKPMDPVTAITANLNDPKDVLDLAKKKTFAYRIRTAGDPSTLENRFASLMLKSYFLQQQSDLALTDQDFLTLALTPEKAEDASAKAADVGGEWVLPNVDSLDDSMEINGLKLHMTAGGPDSDMGAFTIKRDLPKLTLPSAEDLRLGGYVAGN